MSLFGGDDVLDHAEDDPMSDAADDNSRSTDDVESSEIAEEHNVDDSSHRSSRETSESSTDDETLSESDSSAEWPRFKGSDRTYHRYNDAEFKMYDALQLERSKDLSGHLYNAFTVKQRVRNARVQQATAHPSRSRWEEGDDIEEWVLPSRWTAWPIPLKQPTDSKRSYTGRNPRRGSGNDIFNVRSWSGEELKGHLVGHVLKCARERWNARDWESDDDLDYGSGSKRRKVSESRPDSRALGRKTAKMQRGQKNQVASRESSVHTTEQTSSSATSSSNDHNGQRAQRSKLRVPRSTTTSEIDDDDSTDGEKLRSARSTSESSQESLNSLTHSRNRSDAEIISSHSPYSAAGEAEILSKPVVSADEERAERLLQPSLQSLLSRLDDLLMALHHSRNAHANPKSIQADKPDKPSKRGRGRPTKPTGPSEPTSSPQPAKRGGGRPAIYPKPLPGESYYLMRKRHANELLQASQGVMSEPMPSVSEDNPSKYAKVRSNSAVGRLGLAEASSTDTGDSSGEVRTRLRDWSEVLGTASLVGWDEAVIERATKRCAALFGENMSFRTLYEDDVPDMTEDSFEYRPVTISSPVHISSQAPHANANGDTTISDASATTSPSPSPSRPTFDPSSLRCPHKECWGNGKDFPIPYRVVEHIIRVHDYDPRQHSEGNGSDMEGGVHVDGFLKPIEKRQGWRAKDRSVRHRKRAQRSRSINRESVRGG